MESLALAGMEMVPHILFGLYYGQVKGEDQALRMLRDYDLKKYVFSGNHACCRDANGRDTASASSGGCLVSGSGATGIAVSGGFSRVRAAPRQIPQRTGRSGRSRGHKLHCAASDEGLTEAERRNLRILYSERCCSHWRIFFTR